MRLFKKLFPPALQRINDRMLVNQPWLWALSPLQHVWGILILNVVLAVLALLAPLSINEVPNIEALWSYLFVLQVAYFCFWIFWQVLFNPQRQFARRFSLQAPAEFLLHFVGILLLLSISYTPTLVMRWRIDQLVEDQEWVSDWNDLLAVGFLHDRSDYWDVYPSAEHFLNGFHNNRLAYETEELQTQVRVLENRVEYFSDTNQFEYQGTAREVKVPVYNPDSVRYYKEKLRGIFQRYPRYTDSYADRSIYDTASPFKTALTHEELKAYQVAWLKQDAKQQVAAIGKYLEVVKKYYFDHGFGPEEVNGLFLEYYDQLRSKSNAGNGFANLYGAAEIRHVEAQGVEFRRNQVRDEYDNLRAIFKAKKWNHFPFRMEMVHVFAIVIFLMANLIFLFRQVRWQWFLAAIGVSLALVILATVFLVYFKVHKEGLAACWQLLIAMGVVSVMVYLGWSTRFHLKSASTAAIMLFACLPYLLLIFQFLADEQFDVYDERKYVRQKTAIKDQFLPQSRSSGFEYPSEVAQELDRLTELHRAHRDWIESLYWYALYVGMLLYWFGGTVFAKRLLDRFRALPAAK